MECANANNGCTDKLTRGIYQVLIVAWILFSNDYLISKEHLTKCLFGQIDCLLGCNQKFLRKYKNQHEQNECINRLVDCSLNCSAKIQHNKIDVNYIL